MIRLAEILMHEGVVSLGGGGPDASSGDADNAGSSRQHRRSAEAVRHWLNTRRNATTSNYPPTATAYAAVLHEDERMDDSGREPQFRPMPPTLQLPTTHEASDVRMGGQTGEGDGMEVAENMILRGPIICEQGPSGPSSPTISPRLKRPSPLTPESLRRMSLLTADCAGGGGQTTFGGANFDANKLSPLSPNYPTSDLGSSPRSSISIYTPAAGSGGGGVRPPSGMTGQDPSSWRNTFRDQRNSDGSDGGKDLLSPGMMFSPSPFSPFSDEPGTPYSQTSVGASPNMSPRLGTKRGASSFHFSFEPLLQPALSSMSLQIPPNPNHFLSVPSSAHYGLLPRERSRSDSDMGGSVAAGGGAGGGGGGGLRPLTVTPASSSGAVVERPTSSAGGQFKKRLLHKYEAEQREDKTAAGEMNISVPRVSEPGGVDSGAIHSSPFGASLVTRHLMPASAAADDAAVFNLWVQRQLLAWQRAAAPQLAQMEGDVTGRHQQKLQSQERHTAADAPPPPSSGHPATSANLNAPPAPPVRPHRPIPLLQGAPVPPAPPPLQFHRPHPQTPTMMTLAGAVSGHHTPRPPYKGVTAAAPIKMWRRSRSESDVVTGQHVCQHCGQAFALHDRLAKHIASRHRDRSASIAEDESAKIHKCTMCRKSFGRSDMLTRHMRLHTGTRPYGCHICGQVFSRSDHLSTHQRTHTGEKPYQCPQCSYAASRRDMITRHMRTHSRHGGGGGGVDEHLLQLQACSSSSSSAATGAVLPLATLSLGDKTDAPTTGGSLAAASAYMRSVATEGCDQSQQRRLVALLRPQTTMPATDSVDDVQGGGFSAPTMLGRPRMPLPEGAGAAPPATTSVRRGDDATAKSQRTPPS